MEYKITLGVSIGLLLLVFYLISKILEKNKSLKRFSGIISIEKEVAIGEDRMDEINKQTSKLNSIIDSRKDLIKSMEEQIGAYEDKTNMIEVSSYEPIFDFMDSEEFKEKILENKLRQKDLISNKLACSAGVEWYVEGSKAKGRKMMNENVKLALRSFNNECDTLITKVKWNNVDAFKIRIIKAFEAINKLNSTNKIVITRLYLTLKENELILNYEKQLKIQDEKDRAKEIADQLREEEKARKEHEKAVKDAEKEELNFAKALELAQKQSKLETGAKLNSLKSKIEELQLKLKEAQSNKDRALSQAQLTRSGYVYVLSNIGSFGNNKYKIGMTRRLNPNDRVKELSGAAVPFVFDTHAMIFCDDAPGLETRLHQYFSSKKVNKVNNRKEFFNVSLEEIKEAVESFGIETEFIMNHEAEQFRLS